MTLELVLFIISSIYLIKIIKYLTSLLTKKTPYDKYVNKILRDYDRLIVETQTQIDKTSLNVIEIHKFTELLDVRDNLKLPIIYNVIIKHEKGEFYIKNNSDIYLYVVKGIDLKK